MASGKKRAAKKPRPRYFSTFIKIFFSVMLIFLLALTAFIITYDRPDPASYYRPADYVPEDVIPPGDVPGAGIISDLFDPPLLTTFLIAGIDDNLLTDVLIVGCFNARTEVFDLISIPRDTFTTLSEGDIKILAEAGRKVPAGGAMKMNAVYAHAGKDLGIYYLESQAEKITGIKIDYYMLVDLAGFRNVVDAVDGIYMDVRPQGLYYHDPEQDLLIDIKGGYQLLDGEAAEGLIRYREDYARADIDRIDVQHAFMKEFFVQVLNKETLIKNAYDIVTTLLNYTRTNFKARDIPKYLRFVKDFNAESINFYTLPGEPVYENESYYMHDMDKTKELVARILADTDRDAETEVSEDALKNLKIQVLNGSDKEGVAQEKAEQLRSAGFNVINVGEYTEAKHIRTRFMLKQEMELDIIESFFRNPLVEVNADIPDVFDVVIITGLSE